MTCEDEEEEEAVFEEFALRFAECEFLDPQALLGLAKDLEWRALREQSKAAASSRESFTKWVDQALLKGAGPAHRHNRSEHGASASSGSSPCKVLG